MFLSVSISANKRGVMLNRIRRWLAAHPYATLTLLVVAMLGPFLAKPFNIDDPLFLWEAHQIQAHPGDPFGFDVNWYSSITPMTVATENPPVASYFIAVAAAVLGWSELALHFAFLLPALAVVLGTYRLARRFCEWPLLAAGATLCMPVFPVSSSTVMCDVLMLAFWVWAVVFWVEGMERENFRQLSFAGLLIALSTLTKYYGVCLLPLLVAYSLADKRRFGRWIACLLIPLAAICAYQWLTRALYGRAMITETVGFTSFAKGIVGVSYFTSSLLALTYTGGCVAVAAFFTPLLWRSRSLMFFSGCAILAAAAICLQNGLLRPGIPLVGASRIFAETQTVFWAVGGVAVLALAVADVWKRRDAKSALLFLWVFGTFTFAAFFNWTVNGRSILPLVPAVGILLARRLGEKVLAGRTAWTPGVAVCLAASAALSFLITRSDYLLAVAVRQSARETFAKYGHGRAAFWYEGHWGFQYYMDLFGAAALDMQHPALKVGDHLAVPLHNCFIFEPKSEAAEVAEVITVQGPQWLTTWSADVGAGFYSFPGPMPFAFGRVPPETVAVYVWKTNSPPPAKN
jgi:4-amino-4-deoxy-L-arabinose transferase-like glycosyltransferase